MDAPPVRYVTTSDGYSIAYAVQGKGMPLVFLAGVFDHVQLAWRYPGMAPWLEALSARFQLVQFDPRGSGLSTRGLPSDFQFIDYLRDLEAVVDHLGLEKLVLCGGGPGTLMAAQYASKHPDRVKAVILPGAALSPAAVRAPAVFELLPAQDWDTFLHSVVPRDRTPEQARETVALLKQSYGQEDFVLRMNSQHYVSTPDLIAKLSQLPVLVLHSRDYALMDVSEAIKVAQLSGGRLTLIDGNTPYGDVDQAMRAIENFLADLPAEPGLHEAPRDSGLSQREIEVLRLIAAGRSNQQIADELVISLNTANRHVSNIYAKTGAVNRAQAAVYARDQGIV